MQELRRRIVLAEARDRDRPRVPVASADVPSAAIASAGSQDTCTAAARSASRHSSTSSSAEASCRANTNSTSGRSIASSVSGTGLLENAPYTMADDTSTTCEAGRRFGVGERTRRQLSVTLSRRRGARVVVADATARRSVVDSDRVAAAPRVVSRVAATVEMHRPRRARDRDTRSPSVAVGAGHATITTARARPRRPRALDGDATRSGRQPVASASWPVTTIPTNVRTIPSPLADVRRPVPGAGGSGPAELGRRPAVRRSSAATAVLQAPVEHRQRRPGRALEYAELARIAGLHVADVMRLRRRLPATEARVTPGQWAQRDARGVPTAVHRAGDVARLDARPARPTAASRSDGADDGRPQQDDGAGDDGHGRRLDGRQARPTRVRGVRPADPPRPTRRSCSCRRTSTRSPAEWRSRLDEMRLWVLAHELAGHRCSRSTTSRDHLPRWCAVTSVRSDPTPRRWPTSSTSLEMSDERPDGRRCSRRSATRRCCSVPFAHPSRWRSNPRSTRPSPSVVGYIDWVVDAVPCASSAATRCGSPRRCGGVGSRSSPDDMFVERLLGIRLGAEQVARGKAFVQGVVDRGRRARRSRRSSPMPGACRRPNEIDAPGLWLARVDWRVIACRRGRRSLPGGAPPVRRRSARRRRTGRRAIGPRHGRVVDERDPGHQPDDQEAERSRERDRDGHHRGEHPRQLEAVSNRAKARPWLALGASRCTMLSNASRPSAAAEVHDDREHDRRRAHRAIAPTTPATGQHECDDEHVVLVDRRTAGAAPMALPTIVPSADRPTASREPRRALRPRSEPEGEVEEQNPTQARSSNHRHRRELRGSTTRARCVSAVSPAPAATTSRRQAGGRNERDGERAARRTPRCWCCRHALRGPRPGAPRRHPTRPAISPSFEFASTSSVSLRTDSRHERRLRHGVRLLQHQRGEHQAGTAPGRRVNRSSAAYNTTRATATRLDDEPAPAADPVDERADQRRDDQERGEAEDQEQQHLAARRARDRRRRRTNRRARRPSPRRRPSSRRA